MNKVFLYLYPIEDYAKVFFYGNDYYDSIGEKRPLEVLNETIQKRYRDKGYQVVFALYPDTKIYGIELKDNDKIIETDIKFSEVNSCLYPNEDYLLKQIGHIDSLIVGGYHYSDCVKRVAEVAYNQGIDTLVDLELTDLFFRLYNQKYFDVEKYNRYNFKSYMINCRGERYKDVLTLTFNDNYQSPVYGFSKEEHEKLK